MRRARGLLVALSLALSAAAAHGQSAGEWSSSAKLWRATCGYCHDGKLAPELRGAGVSTQAVVSAVRHGPNSMPAFAPSEISDQELEQLAGWIEAQPKPATPQPSESERAVRHGTRQRTR